MTNMDRAIEKIQAGNHFAYDDTDLRRQLAPIEDDLCRRPTAEEIIEILMDACPAAGQRFTAETTARRILALMDEAAGGN